MEQRLPARLWNVFTRIFEGLVLFCIFVFLNSWAFLGSTQFPDVSLFNGIAWGITPGLILVTAFMLGLVWQKGGLLVLVRVLSNNRWLVLFILVSCLSLLWTVYLPATLYELSLLLFSLAAAAYIAVHLRVQGFIAALTWMACLATLVSLALVLYNDVGVMLNEPFVGSWRGLFWHRNHAGSLMAFFNMLFLARFLWDDGLRTGGRLLCAAFYLLTALHVFGSRSAAGILIFMFLNLSVAVFYFWLKLREKLVPAHYYVFFIGLAVGFLIFVSDLEFFFGLLGRTANMTGRTPLWKDLLENFYLEKPLLGYGYGALWMQESFRELMQSRHGWKYPVYFADNGFLDILLNLGAIGLFLFLGMYMQAARRGIQRIRETHSWKYIFLFLVLLYVTVANVAYSFLLEVDHFVWVCFIVVVMILQMSEAEASG